MDILKRYSSFLFVALAALLIPRLLAAETIQVGKKVIQGMAISVALEPPKIMQMMGGMEGMGGMGGMGKMPEWKTFRPVPGKLSHHVTVVLMDSEGGERIPYATLSATIVHKKSGEKMDKELPAMFGKNLIYGTNVLLKPGGYDLTLTVQPPSLMRVEGAVDKWLKPITARFSFEVK